MYGWYDYHKNIKNVALSFMTEGIQWLKLIKTNKTFYRHITSLKYYFIKIIFYLIMHLYKDSIKIRRILKKIKKVLEFLSLFLCVNIFSFNSLGTLLMKNTFLFAKYYTFSLNYTFKCCKMLPYTSR